MKHIYALSIFESRELHFFSTKEKVIKYVNSLIDELGSTIKTLKD